MTYLMDKGLKKSSNVGMLLLSWQFFLPQQHPHPLICIQPASLIISSLHA